MTSNITGQPAPSYTPSTNLPSTVRREGTSDMAFVSCVTLPDDQAKSFARRGNAENRHHSPLAVTPVKATNPDVSSSTLSVGSFEPVESPQNAHVSLGSVEESRFDPAWPIALESPDHDTETLTRLFSALKMDPRDISCNPPAQAVVEVSTPTMDTISLQDLEICSFDGRLVPWVAKQAAICETVSQKGSEEDTPEQGTTMFVSHQYGSKKRTTTGALKYSFADMIFPSSKVVEPDPFSLEVYPFPRDQRRRLEVLPVSNSDTVWRKEMNECMIMINKLGSAALGSSPATTARQKRLAIAYCKLGYYDKAEHQFKRILPALEQRHGKHSPHVILVRINLAKTIFQLGRYRDANQMAQHVHTWARRLDPGGVLYQEAARVLARSFGYLGNLMREEELLRELVQIRLNAFGPKHGDTLVVIEQLCGSIIAAKRHSESEELLRVALELSSNATHSSSRRKYLICRRLGITLYKQGKYADSEALLRKTTEMSEKLLGIEHSITLNCKLWLCRVLRARGLLLESHDILLDNVKSQIRTWTELRGSTIEYMAELSVVLIEMRNVDNAYKWMERALSYSVETGGTKTVRAVQFFEDLSSFNKPERQHTLIAALYRRMASKIINSTPVLCNMRWIPYERSRTEHKE